jgi:hypothetical protein
MASAYSQFSQGFCSSKRLFESRRAQLAFLLKKK